MARKVSIAAAGVDEYRQGITADPWGSAFTSAPGLRVPLFPNTNTTRYMFLLATCQIDQPGIRLVGMKTHYTIGSYFRQSASLPFSVQEQKVETPEFSFPDGNVSFHLVLEPNVKTVLQRPSTDAANFCFREADGPALLYGTPGTTGLTPCSWSAGYFSPITGAPLYYSAGMTGYLPPSKVSQWEPVASLGCFYHGREDNIDLWIPARSSQRLSLYATVLQTNPATRSLASIESSGPIQNAPPEQRPVLQFPQTVDGSENILTYGYAIWRVYGEIIVDLDRGDPPAEQPLRPVSMATGRFVQERP